MNKSAILAHRGHWLNYTEKNSRLSLERALLSGFGLETDVRDLNGELVISHDPPIDSVDLPRLSWLFEKIKASASTGRIALNIKSDGLKVAIEELVETSKINVRNIYVFDMSVPESMRYIGESIPVYSRISEHEVQPSFLENVQGVWVDSFTGEFSQIQNAKKLMSEGFRVAIVSPELHSRDHQPLWNAILESGIHQNSLFELCTDFPLDAAIQFCNPSKMK